jgi:asparagine synthase (glutamine-hydrolysing)
MYRAARSRYHVLGMESNNKVAAQHGLEIAFPFLDRDLIVLLMGLPGEMIAWKGVPKGLLRTALDGIMPDRIVRRASKADFTQLINEGIARDHHRLVECLASGRAAVAFGFLKPEALTMVAQARPSADLTTCTLSWALKDLLSLELWLQQFFGSPGRQVITEAS